METNAEPSEIAAAEPTSAEPKQSQGTAWPFLVYILALLMVDGVGFAVARKDPSEILIFSLVCIVYGQTALAMVVSGLMGRNWLEGVFLSTFAVICHLGVGGVSSGSLSGESLLYAAIVPFVCLMGAFPLILFRWTVGWKLQPETMEALPRSRITIEDLILVPASFVAFWVMALAPMGADSNDSVWNSMLEPILPLMCVCTVLVLPCTYFAFRIQDSGFRWVVCMGCPLVVSIVAIVIAVCYGLPGDALGWAIFGTFLGTGVFTLGLQLLYTGGYRLVNYKSAAVAHGTLTPAEHHKASSTHLPFDLEPAATPTSGNADPQASSRKRYRIAVATLLVATAIVNTGMWTYAQMQQRRALVKIIADGGKVEWANGQPIKISFGPATTEDEIRLLPSMPTVTSLDIRKTNFSPDQLQLDPSIEIIVSEGRFTGSHLQDFKLQGLIVKEVAD